MTTPAIKEWLGVGDEQDEKKLKRKTPKEESAEEVPIPEGSRNGTMFDYCVRLARLGLKEEEVAALAVTKAMECEEGSHEYTDEEIMWSANSALSYAQGGLTGDRFVSALYIDEICSDSKVITLHGEPYVYEGGVFKPWPVEEIKRRIWELSHRTASVAQINNTLELLGIETFVHPDEVNPPGWLNTRSGIINPESGELVPHSPDKLFTVQLLVVCEHPPKGENPRPPRCPLFSKYLEQALPDPLQRDLVWEIIGYCLTTDCRMEKAIILFGFGGNGKTVLLNVIRALLRGFVSELRLSELTHRFRSAMLTDKLVNISSENEAVELVDDALVKSLISGEPLTVEQKHKDPITIKPFAKLIIAGNHFPRSRDRSKGYFRRWLTLHFNQEIPEDKQDKQLSEKIVESELDEIFYGALIGLQRLRRNGRFTVPESSRALLEEYERTTNPVLTFIEQHIAIVPDGREYLQDIYNKYRSWCEGQGHRNPLNQPNFRKEIEQRTGKIVERLTGGKFGFKGLVLVEAQRIRDIQDGIKRSKKCASTETT